MMTTNNKKPAPRRAMSSGRRIWVRLSRAEFTMLGLEEQIPMSDYDDTESDRVRVAGVVVIGEPHYHLIHIAIGNHVLRLSWARVIDGNSSRKNASRRAASLGG